MHAAGTSGKVLKTEGDSRVSAATDGFGPWREPFGFLLDLLTGTTTDAESLRRLAETAAVAFTGTLGKQVDSAVTLDLEQRGQVRVANNGRAAALATLEHELGDGPLTHAMGAAGAVLVSTTGTGPQWPAYRQRVVAAGYGEVLAVPLLLDPGSSCAVAFFAPPGGSFTPDSVSHATWFAGVAAQSLKLALEVRSVRSAGDNLKSVLESRTSIDVACGVIMGRNRCSYSDAFGMLASASSHRKKQVREVAEGILKEMPSGPPRTKFAV